MLGFVAAMLIGAQAEAPTRAEVCHAQVQIFIQDVYQETGRVAGPSWFVLEWWVRRLAAAEQTPERVAKVREVVDRGRSADPAAFEAERRSCIEEAMDAGAVP